MYLRESGLNPLPQLLDILKEDTRLFLSNEILTSLGTIFFAGGVVAETFEDVINILKYIEEWYGIWKLETIDNKQYLIRE